MKAGCSLFLLLALGGPVPAHASSIDKLKSFIQQSSSARAQFSQQLLDKNGRSVQQASGVMELRDQFGQTTVLRFSSLERNPRLNPDLFKFTPPKDADVLGD